MGDSLFCSPTTKESQVFTYKDQSTVGSQKMKLSCWLRKNKKIPTISGSILKPLFFGPAGFITVSTTGNSQPGIPISG